MDPSDKDSPPGLDYERLDAILAQIRTAVTAAEGHGTLCGLGCVRSVVGAEVWEPLILGDSSAAEDAMTEGRQMLAALWRHSVAQLESPECVFQPFLPPDNQRLSLRTAGLASWCNGFLYGLGLGGADFHGRLSEEATEFLRDLSDISRVDATDPSDESDEAAYAEVFEYVRVGVLLVFEDLRPFRELPGTDRVH